MKLSELVSWDKIKQIGKEEETDVDFFHFRLRWKVVGEEVRARLYCRTSNDGGFDKKGDLTFKRPEWEDFRRKVAWIEAIPDSLEEQHDFAGPMTTMARNRMMR